jgi:hypothetical protein
MKWVFYIVLIIYRMLPEWLTVKLPRWIVSRIPEKIRERFKKKVKKVTYKTAADLLYNEHRKYSKRNRTDRTACR